jgi:hypothetical protein
VILCIGVLFLLCLNLFSADGSVAVVEVDGEIVSQLKLDTDTKYDIVIDGKVTNTVVIDNLTAYVINANCPDKICQNHNPISKNGESIVCLPNKVVVTISGDDNEIDGVVR